MSGRVVVVGSANADLTIEVDHAPAAGETVLGGAIERGPGGKGLNQAVAAARMEADTVFVGVLGADAEGDQLLDLLVAEGVDVAGVQRLATATGLAVILREPDGGNRIVVASGANAQFDQVAESEFVAIGLGPADVVVAQLEVPVAAVARWFRLARDAGARTVLNAAPAREDLETLLDHVDVLVVNEPELRALSTAVQPIESNASPSPDSGLMPDEADRLIVEAQSVPGDCDVVVTLGENGALVVVAAGRADHLSAPTVDVVDTTGAGDCFVGVLAAHLAAGAELLDGARVAVHAASQSVKAPGAAPALPFRHDLDPSVVPSIDQTELS